MGKTPEAGEWHIFLNKKTHALIAYNPQIHPTFPPNGAKHEYEEVGLLRRKEDAEKLIAFQEIGMAPDAVELLRREHVVRESIHTGELPPDTASTLYKQMVGVREETGQNCFGCCGSLAGNAACGTCFVVKRDMWNLCAHVKCVLTELSTTMSRVPSV